MPLSSFLLNTSFRSFNPSINPSFVPFTAFTPSFYLILLLYAFFFFSFLLFSSPTHVHLYDWAFLLSIPVRSFLCHPSFRDANQSDFIVFSTTNRAKYDNTILPIKIRFSPNVCLPLSLSFLLFYFLPNNNFSLAFYLASLFGGNPTKIKSWRSIFLTCPDLISVVLAHCTVLYCTHCVHYDCTPYIPYLFGSSPHRIAKQLFVPIYSILC